MSVDHEGTVYSERCYGKKTTFFNVFIGLFGPVQCVEKKGILFKEYTERRTLRFLLYSIYFGPKSGGDKN